MLDQENKQNSRKKTQQQRLSRCTRKQLKHKHKSAQTGLREAPASSARGRAYLALDEAGGGVGGRAAIRALEAALAFRQLPGQLRA